MYKALGFAMFSHTNLDFGTRACATIAGAIERGKKKSIILRMYRQDGRIRIPIVLCHEGM